MQRDPTSFIARAVAVLVLASTAVFAAGVLWFQVAEPWAIRALLVAAWVGFAIVCAVPYVRGASARGLAVYALPFVVLVVWFSLIEPRSDRAWSPEMARTLTYVQKGNEIAVSNVRNFHWRTQNTAVERWERRHYDLSTLATVDIVSLYWKGPHIAHTYFSFVWANGDALSISVEIRKEAGEAYSPIGGFFKAYEIAILAGDERDFYGWRIFFPKEDIQLFHTRASPAEARRLLLELLKLANDLAKTPAFYNTITNNCTTEAWLLTEAVGAGKPLSWRTLASGYLPDMLYDLQILDTSRSLQDLRNRGHILAATRRAIRKGLAGPAFSTAIRAGVPGFPGARP